MEARMVGVYSQSVLLKRTTSSLARKMFIHNRDCQKDVEAWAKDAVLQRISDKGAVLEHGEASAMRKCKERGGASFCEHQHKRSQCKE